LQPILPKSQCWCIEEDSSKFVLQIRKPQYWRIELPVTDIEDRERAFLLRDIFDQILLFEKTRCPFKRSFTVQLPEPPQTPIKKKPWTPARRSFVPIRAPESPETPPTPIVVRSLTRPAFYEPKPTTSSTPPQMQTPTKSSRLKDVDSATESKPPTIPETADVRPETTGEQTEPSANGREVRYAGGPDQDLDQPGEASQSDAPGTTPETEREAEPAPGPLKETTQVETPVKVKQVVSVIEERIAEEPVPPRFEINNVTTPEPKPEEPRWRQPSTPTPHAKTNFVHTTSAADLRTTTIKMGALTPTTPVTAIPRFESRAIEPVSSYGSYGFSTSSCTLGSNAEEAEDVEEEVATYADITIREEEAESTTEVEPTAAHEVAFDEVHEGSGQGSNILMKRKLRRYGGFSSSRSTMTPPHLTLITSSSSRSVQKTTETVADTQQPEPCQDPSETSGTVSPTESADSFHSVRAWQSPISPPVISLPDTEHSEPQMFPYPHDNIVMPNQVTHQRDVSDSTVTPDTRCTWDAMSTTSSSATSQLSAITAPDTYLDTIEECGKSNVSEDGACFTTARKKDRSALRHRSTASISTNRVLSPLPAAAALFSPPQSIGLAMVGPTRQQQQHQQKSSRSGTRIDVLRRMPLAIVAKTCDVLLGPPAYLVTLMLKVASKIAAGEWRGMVFGFGERGEKIPVQWDYSDGDGDLDWDSDEDADFAPPPSAGEKEEQTREVGSSEDDDDDNRKDGRNTSDEDDTGRTWGVD